MRRLWILLAAAICVVGGSALAQPDVVVSDVELPNLRWGAQQASFTVTNNSDQYKFISVITDMQFEGSYLSPSRTARSNYVLLDNETYTIEPVIDVPGNYGKARINVKIYDVVDTLDPVFETQKVYEQPFMLNYHPPDAVIPYLQERLDLPPRVNEHPDFDSEFSRILLLMIEEAKTPEQIAATVECDVEFVRAQIKQMMARFYVVSVGDGIYTTDFPVITLSEAKQLRPIAERMADSLAAIVARNMPAYDSLVRALEAEGKMPEDTIDFIHGGTILYHKYPVVAAMLLWYDLASQFITEGKPLRIFQGTDLCNANIHRFMYAIQGGDHFRGTHFYHEEDTGPSISILYGDRLPGIKCEDDFIRKGALRQRVNYEIRDGFIPEAFIIDTLLIRQATHLLSEDVDPLMRPMYMDVLKIARENRHTQVSLGYRWYIWNLTASIALEQLIDDGIVERHRNGQFKLEAFDFGWK